MPVAASAATIDSVPEAVAAVATSPSGTRTQSSNQAAAHQLVERLPHGEIRGVDPRSVSRDALAAAGHEKQPLLAVIRAMCISCSGGSRAEANWCTATGCPLWAYRRGTNPFSRRTANSRSFRPRAPEPVPDTDQETGAGETAFLAATSDPQKPKGGGST
jgi:hypothetical protein